MKSKTKERKYNQKPKSVSITNNQNGYTLLELTVVMILLITVGAMIVAMLSSTIRGNAKSKITNDLGQNGNYALSVLSDIILNSQNFQSIGSVTTCTPVGVSGQTITVLGFDGGATTILCNDATGAISSASAIFSNITPTPTPYRTVSLLDTSRVVLVPGTCKFTCVQADSYSPPRIDITFQLKNANGTGIATFNTSLSLRNKTIK